MTKPLIFITNDDGVNAPGIRKLIESVRELGSLLILAPDKPQSAMGHAVTIQTPLRVTLIKEEKDYLEYSCNGTPADCVKLGEKMILKQKPDIIVSGINHGCNASINVLYSGTMAAVIEGAMSNIPAIGFSLDDHSPNANFDHCVNTIKSLTQHVLKNKLPNGVCLNVNFPKISNGGLKGVKITKQAKAYWDENFDQRNDPHNRKYYWLRGQFICIDDDNNNDLWALQNNYVSIVPTQIDLTAYQIINEIKNWEIDF